MNPANSRMFWALLILSNIWVAEGSAFGRAYAATLAILAIFVWIVDRCDRACDIPPGRGDLEKRK